MTRTKIEWSDEVWNPVTGCTKVSPGCDHCYAERITERFHGPGSFAEVKLHPDRLDAPLRWRKPRRVFVNSMSDLFHADVPDQFIAQVFAVMSATPRHTFQVLTKRPARMRSLLTSEEFRTWVWYSVGHSFTLAPDRRRQLAVRTGHDASRIGTWPLPNVWLGVSVEDQKWADTRIPALLDTPAAVRFVSCEPLLGPVDLKQSVNVDPFASYLSQPTGISWVIVGGESGPGARPMHLTWARRLRDQCRASGIPFFFKQWGEWAPAEAADATHLLSYDGSVLHRATFQPGTSSGLRRVGKKAAGRELDGRTWDEYPAGAS